MAPTSRRNHDRAQAAPAANRPNRRPVRRPSRPERAQQPPFSMRRRWLIHRPTAVSPVRPRNSAAVIAPLATAPEDAATETIGEGIAGRATIDPNAAIAANTLVHHEAGPKIKK